jgi:hypothetical protein
VRDERDLEGALGERGDRERDTADRNRALLHAVAQELRRRRDPHPRALLLRLDRLDAPDAVDVALDVVAAERLTGSRRGLEVDLVPLGEGSERRPADRLGNRGDREVPVRDLGRRQAAAVDGNGVADGELRGRRRSLDAELPRLGIAVDLGDAAPLSDDPRKHA